MAVSGMLYVVSAFGLGALHALEPGHGKSLMAAYLVGSRGRPWDAVVLGLVVTLTHTLSVYMLAALTLVAARYFAPAWVEHYLELISGLLVLAVGAWLVWQRAIARLWAGWNHRVSHALNMRHNHDHDHGHGHGHDHHHDHSHEHPHGSVRTGERLDTRALIALGVSGGVVPCPGALAVLLTAVAAGGLSDVLQGLGLVVVFSLGLASVLIGLGLSLVLSVNWLEKRIDGSERYAPLVGQASAWFIFALGAYLTVRAVWA